MRIRGVLLALIAGLGLGLVALSGRTASANDNDKIAKLVEDLGSKKFVIRDKAKRALEAIGAPALEQLRKAAKSTDLETAKRAHDLVKRLEEKSTLESLLAPKTVKLSFKDTPVTKAIEELSKQSGYTIQIQGDRTKLAERKVTLEVGPVPFWQAFDELCEKAGLSHLTNNPYGSPYGQPAIDLPLGRPIQIQPVPIQIQPAPAPAVPIQIRPNIKVLPAQPAQPAPAAPPAPGDKPVQAPAAPPVQILPAQNGNAAIQIRLDIQGAAPAQVEIPVVIPAQNAAQPKPADAPKKDAPAPMPAQGAAGGAGGAGGAGVARPVQIQIQPGQIQVAPAQPVQVQPGFVGRPTPQQVPGQINVIDGKAQKVPTFYAGAIRIRLLPAPNVQGGPVQVFPGGGPGLPGGGAPGFPGGAPGAAPPGAAVPPQPPVAKQNLNAKRDEVTFLLEVTPEPRLVSNFNVLGNVQVTTAVDDLGQKLAVPMDPMPGQPGFNPNGGANGGIAIINGRRQIYYNPYGQGMAYVRLKLGEKQAKSLKELTGTLSVQMLTPPQDIVSVDNVMKSAGKKVEGPSGGTIEVKSVEKLDNGNIRVKFQLEQPQNIIFQNPFQPAPGGMPGGVGGGAVMPGGGPVQIQIQPAIQPVPPQVGGGRVPPRFFNAHGLPVLMDAKGKMFNLAENPQRNYQRGFGAMPVQEVTMVFAPQAGQADPARLVLSGQRHIQVPVPFSFQNVTLP